MKKKKHRFSYLPLNLKLPSFSLYRVFQNIDFPIIFGAQEKNTIVLEHPVHIDWISLESNVTYRSLEGIFCYPPKRRPSRLRLLLHYHFDVSYVYRYR